MKKKYKYAKAIIATAPIYDLLNTKGILTNYVKSYDVEEDEFIETVKYSNEKLYEWVMESENISYEMFINSPKISIALLEDEYEKKIQIQKNSKR